MKKEIYQKWLERVKYDIDTAEAMYSTGRYIYAIFMCQQAIEKSLKALLVFKGIEIIGGEAIISAGSQSKASLIGKNKIRLNEMENILGQYFDVKKVRIK